MENETFLKVLEQEKEKYARNITTFAILTGLFLTLLFVGVIIYVVLVANGAMSIENGTADESAMALKIGLGSIGFILICIVFALAADAFTALIIVNAIKYGKRKRLIQSYKLNNSMFK